jgi:hypothetical protein
MITLKFEPQELDYVFRVLTQRPWAEVNPLVLNLQRQIQEQQNAGPVNAHGPIEPPPASPAG